MNHKDKIVKCEDIKKHNKRKNIMLIENISKVNHKKINWLWKNKIAYGKITLFAGEPGVGKSQLLLYIASIMTLGKSFHSDEKVCEKGNVLLISGEDSADDTIKPRLMALGADLSRIDYIKGIQKWDDNGNEYHESICIIDNMNEIEQKIIENNHKLLIIDPISMYLGSVDENNNKEIRRALSIINALAERHQIAVVLNSHFSKPNSNIGKNAIYRVMGSIGFAAAARIIFGIMKDPDDENDTRRLFLPIKNNLGNDREGFVYKIRSCVVEEIETSKVEWVKEKVTTKADDVLNSRIKIELVSPRLQEVKDFLLGLLKDGPKKLTEIRQKAKDKGFSIDRLYKAKNELSVEENYSTSKLNGKIWSITPPLA